MAHRTKSKEGNGAHAQAQASDSRNVTTQTSAPPARLSEHPLRRLRDEVGAMFDRFFEALPTPWEWGFAPERFWAVDVQDEDKEVRVRVEAPGFEPKDFDVEIRGNMLTIRAEQQQKSEDAQEGVRSWAQRHARFYRSIPLSADVKADQVEAQYRNGVLELRLPRTEEAQRRRIEVKS
jgi:HSP20 family protein